MFDFEVTEHGLKESMAGLERGRKFLDFGLIRRLQRISSIAHEDIKRNFDSEGKHTGQPWPLLTPATQEHRDWLAMTWGLSIGPDHPMLVNWGEFRESVVEKHGKDHTVAIGQHTVEIASTHKKGGMTEAMAGIVHEGRGSAPPRPLFHPEGATPAALVLMRTELEGHAEAVARLITGEK